MQGTFLFLGTGASAGVPVIGCECSVCHSNSCFDKRGRTAGLLEIERKKILIDVGPDFRQQALLNGIDILDGLVITHVHSDHIAGIDDLRIFYFRQKKPLPCLVSVETFEELKVRYYYLFRSIGEVQTISAQLEFHLLEDDIGEINFLEIPFTYLSYFQGGMKVTGFRVGDFAYVSDIRQYGEEIFIPLKGTKTLVLSAIGEAASPLHLSLDEAIAFAKKVGAQKTWLTHLSHQVDHEKVSKALPSGVALGYDGLKISF